MAFYLLIFSKIGLFVLSENIKNKINIIKQGYFGPYEVAIAEYKGNLPKFYTPKRKYKDFYLRILSKIVENPGDLENALTLQSYSTFYPDTPYNFPDKVILIYTKEEGLYSIPGYLLRMKGVNLDTIDPAKITIISNKGKIPVILKGMEDGKFDINDEIIFYAERLHGNGSYYHLYSFENVYVLFFNRKLTIELPEEDVKPEQNSDFLNTAHFNLHFEEERIFADLDPSHSDTQDIWFWKLLEQDKEETLKINLPVAVDSENYKFNIYFDTGEIGAGSYNHKIFIKWGNVFIDSFIYSSLYPQIIEFFIPGNILNQDSLLIIEEKEIFPNYLNWVEVEGNFYLDAKGKNSLKFKFDGIDGNVEIKGFTDKPKFLININKKVYKNFETFTYLEGGKILYGLKAKINENLPSEYYVTDKINFPDSIVLYKKEKDIKEEAGTQVLIIYHPKFKQYADSLRIFHSSAEGGNYSVKTFSVKDIYVQFNCGIKDPHAIRKFLKYFWMNKKPKFNYVILLGDASKDPRDIKGGEMKDYIPIFYQPSTFIQFETDSIFTGFFSSDFYYSTIVGEDPFPDVVVSRIPVQSLIECKIIFEKIKRYANKNPGIWRRHFILGTEMKNEPGSIYRKTNNMLISFLKPGMTYVEPDESETSENLIRYMSDGAAIFNFIGHGGHHSLWAKAVFRQEDLWEIKNYDKYFFFTAFSCWTGEFGRSDARAFGEEALLIPKRGAIATISLAGSGKAPANVNIDISTDYSKSIFIGYLRDSILKIGDLILFSRMYILSRHNIRDRFTSTTIKTSSLLGDPLLELPFLENVKVLSSPSSVLPGDSIELFVPSPPLSHGISIWEVIYKNMNDTIIARDLYLKNFDNGNLSIKIKVPDTLERAKVNVNLYAYRESPFKEIIGSGNFSISLANVDSIYFIPDIFSEDTFRLFAKISLKNPVISCELWYSETDSIEPETLQMVPMSALPDGFFKTDTTLPPLYYKYFYYTFVVVDTSYNTYYTDTFRIKKPGKPDIALSKKLINITPSETMPRINFPYTNLGGRETGDFLVFYRIETPSCKLLERDTLTVNSLKRHDTRILSIPLPCTTYYKYKIILDLDNRVEEQEDVENNADSGVIFNPYFYIDTNGFKAEFNFKSYKVETNFYPSKDLSIFYIKKKKNKMLKDSTFILEAIKENKKNDTIALFKIQNINEKKDILLKTGIDSLWHKIDYEWDSLNKEIKFYLAKEGEIALFNISDSVGPQIEVYSKNKKIEGNVIRTGKKLDLKILLRDSSGIDLLFKKPEIKINGEKYDYENSMIRKEKSVIIRLKKKNLKEGNYTLKISAYDAMGNKTEREFELFVLVPFNILYYGNYPNPAKEGKTTIFYELTKEAEAMEIKIYTISGRLIKEFKTDDQGFPVSIKGKHKITWNLRDFYGNRVSNGVYFLLLKGKRKGKERKITAKIAVGE